MNAKISAIIPTYNRSPFSPEDRRNPLYISTYALYEQTLFPEELIIVDDCSQDNTSRLVENLQKNYPIAYVRMEKRSGNTFTRRRGVEQSNNPLLLFLDDDSFPMTRNALECLYSRLEKHDLDAVAPPILFRGTEFDSSVASEKIGKLDGYRVYSNFDKTPHPYSEVIEVSNLPGIFLAKREIIKPEYFVKFSWLNNWGNESFLAWNLTRDKRKLGYIAKRDAAFIHLKFGWHMDNFQTFDEEIDTLPEDLNFRDLLNLSNKQIRDTGYREILTSEDWYRCTIAFSTFMYLLGENSIDGLSEGLESFIRSGEFCGYGHPTNDRIPEIIDDGIEIGKREYKRFLDFQT